MRLKTLFAILAGLIAAGAAGRAGPTPAPVALGRADRARARAGKHAATSICRPAAASSIQLRPDAAPGHVERIKTLTRQRLLQRPHLPPRDRRLHGADRRSQRRPAPAAPSFPTSRPNSTPCRTSAAPSSAARAEAIEQRQQPVLHHVRAALRARRQIYGRSAGCRRHAICRRDRARRAAAQSDADRPRLDRRRQCPRALLARAAS